MVKEPVDGGGGQGLGHDRVEAGGVQVAGDGDGAAFVGGVDDAVERLTGWARGPLGVQGRLSLLHSSVHSSNWDATVV